MQAGATGHSTIWVMLSEATMWDARQLMNEWLNQHGTVVEKAEFPGVTVLRYQMKEQ